VITKHREGGGHSPRWAAEPEKINKNYSVYFMKQKSALNIRKNLLKNNFVTQARVSLLCHSFAE
jgi:hypothetical protein